MFLEEVAGDELVALWRLEVPDTLVMVSGRPQPSEPKTAAGRRRIALDDTTVAALQEHRDRQNGEREFFGDSYQDGGWVFSWPDGRPYSPDWIGKRYRELVRATDLPYIRFHDLRHTWATLAVEAGIPAKVVADRLGHAGIAITLDTYTHHIEHLDRDAADKVAGLLA